MKLRQSPTFNGGSIIGWTEQLDGIMKYVCLGYFAHHNLRYSQRRRPNVMAFLHDESGLVQGELC